MEPSSAELYAHAPPPTDIVHTTITPTPKKTKAQREEERKKREEDKKARELLREEARLKREQEKLSKEEAKQKREEERKLKEAAKEEEKKRKEEDKRQKEHEKKLKEQLKEADAKSREENRLKREYEKKVKEDEKRAKDEAKAKQEEDTRRQKERQQGLLMNFVKKVDAPLPTTTTVLPLEVYTTPIEQFDKILKNDQDFHTLLAELRSKKRMSKKRKVIYKGLPLDIVLSPLSRMKLLKFHDNIRPAYFGTFSKKSKVIKPRRPFAKDEEVFDYDFESDDEWDAGDGESLSDASDDEQDKEKEDKEKDDEDEEDEESKWVVPDGYLSSDEGQKDSDDERAEESQKTDCTDTDIFGKGKKPADFSETKSKKEKDKRDKRPVVCGPISDVVSLDATVKAAIQPFFVQPLIDTPIDLEYFRKCLEHGNTEHDDTTTAKNIFPESVMVTIIQYLLSNTCGMKKLVEGIHALVEEKHQIAKRQIEFKIREIAVKEKLKDRVKPHWHVRDDILKAHPCIIVDPPAGSSPTKAPIPTPKPPQKKLDDFFKPPSASPQQNNDSPQKSSKGRKRKIDDTSSAVQQTTPHKKENIIQNLFFNQIASSTVCVSTASEEKQIQNVPMDTN